MCLYGFQVAAFLALLAHESHPFVLRPGSVRRDPLERLCAQEGGKWPQQFPNPASDSGDKSQADATREASVGNDETVKANRFSKFAPSADLEACR